MRIVLRVRPARSRRGRLPALLVAPLLALALLAGVPAAAAPPPAEAGAETGAAAAPSAAKSVTLITGDTVTWADGAGDPMVDIAPAARPDGGTVQFVSEGAGEDFYVYPSDAARYLAAGVLDRELFNIPALIAQGLDDATTGELPVIVTFDDQPGRQRLAREADALPATKHPVGLRALNGAGVRVERGDAERFWAAIADERPDHGTTPATLEGDVARVVLDRTVRVLLEDSVPQIGAPQLWAAGYTGGGIDVAVLDTGVDAAHPDLVGKVIAEQNFTESDTAGDRFGHGTHVASTITGSGAASDGRHKGVAPDAGLMNGKVLGDGGSGQFSWIIAGMEWAAASGADIVNMSLGACCTDGTDILSQAVNELTAEYGTLFVVAAGNDGERGVAAPGSADAALTVGAVDKADQLASFSSRGPRLIDFAAKPNLTAPGVDIVAARAAGTSMGSPVDESYTASNGTSMATPHVAGAAALLAQARPDLGAPELKDALASTTVDGGFTWREQGTGRLDAARAATQGIYASASADFGSLDGADSPVERAVTYANHTDTDVTLDLDSSITNGAGEPVEDVTLSADTVTVPAGDQAAVTVTVDPGAYPLGKFGGAITATAPDVRLRTAVGFGQLNMKTLTVRVLDHDGRPLEAPVGVWLVHDTFDQDNPIGEREYMAPTVDGVATAQVPAGIYTPMVSILELDPERTRLARITFMTETEVDVTSDATITLDARDTVAVSRPTVPKRVDVRGHMVSLQRIAATTFPAFPEPTPGKISMSVSDWVLDGNPIPYFVTPAAPGRIRPTSLIDYWLLAEPKPLEPAPPVCYPRTITDTPAYTYHLPFMYPNGIPRDLQQHVERRDLVLSPNRYHAEHPDMCVVVGDVPRPGVSTFTWVGFRPGAVDQYYLASDHFEWWIKSVSLRRGPAARLISGDAFPESEAGRRRSVETWFEAPLRVGAVEIRDEFLDYYFRNTFLTSRSAVLARGGPDGNEFVPATGAMDNHPSHTTGGISAEMGSEVFGSWRMWNADTGAELAGEAKYGNWPVFRLSPEPGTYRLEQTETYPPSVSGLFRTKPSATTEWTFRSRSSDAEVARGHSCSRLGGGDPRQDPDASLVCQFQPLIQLRYELGLDLRNQAPAGRAHMVTIEAGSHSGAPDRSPVTSLSVEYSTDDGQTWRQGRVVGRPADDGTYQTFRVVLPHPPLHRTNGFVWLRIQAEDANGGTVEQTIQRAYLLE